MRNFRDFKVGEKSHVFALNIYKTVQQFPSEEKLGLISQMKRSSASIPTNIAEGCGQGSDSGFSGYLHIAFGSVCELEYRLILANDLKFIDSTEFSELTNSIIEIKKMLTKLIQKIYADGEYPAVY